MTDTISLFFYRRKLVNYSFLSLLKMFYANSFDKGVIHIKLYLLVFSKPGFYTTVCVVRSAFTIDENSRLKGRWAFN